jgi:hypothetical protein
METKNGGLKKNWDSFHNTLGGVEKIQDGSRCHGNQDAKNVKFKPYSISF